MKKCPECGLEIESGQTRCYGCDYRFSDDNDVTMVDLAEIYKLELDPLKEKIQEKYEILDFLGKGGFSTVFKLRDRTLDRLCALKVLSKNLLIEREMVDRFKQEAQLYAKLDHANIVQVFDVGFYNNVAYIIMKYIDGIDLKAYIKENTPIPVKNVISISKDIASVLSYMHKKGIVHRDIKPANIMIQHVDHKAILTDFGLAKRLDTTHFTSTGKIMGSPHYLAPEQAKGEAIDARTDIYSLGITIFEMATGKVPFGGETPVQVVIKHINEQIPKPSTINININRFLEKIILKATKKNPQDRYSSMDELIRDLDKLESLLSKTPSPEVKKPHAKRILIGVPLLLLIVAGGLYFSGIFSPGGNGKADEAVGAKLAGEKKQTIEKSDKTVNQEVANSRVEDKTSSENRLVTEKKIPEVIQPEQSTVEKIRPVDIKRTETGNNEAVLTLIPVSIQANAQAEVFVDGKQQGKVPPGISLKIKPGKHHIMFVKSNTGKAVFQEFEVKDKPVDINYEFNIFGNLELVSANPWGNLYIDGNLIGMTPLQNVKVKEGIHQVIIQNPKYPPFKKEINVIGGEKIPAIHHNFIDAQPVFSFIRLIHVSPWGEVYLDDTLLGNSPIRDVKVSAGDHTLRIKHPKYKDVVKKITIQKGEDVSKITINMEEGNQ